MARSDQPGRTRSFKASYVDRSIVGAVDGSQIEPARASQGVQTSPIKPDGASLERHWHSRTPRGRPRSVSGASWGVPECPRSTKRVPEVATGHEKERPGASGSVPRQRKSRLSRTRDGKHRAFLARLARKASSERCSLEFLRFCMFLPRLRTL